VDPQQQIAVSIGDDLPIRHFPLDQAIYIANTLHQQGEFKRAYQAYQSILKALPDHPECLRLLGVLQFQQGLWDQAEQNFQKSLKHHPGSTETQINLAALYKAREDYDAAGALLKSVIQAQPDMAQAHNNLAAIRQAQGRFTEAVACYQSALKQQGDYHTARLNLAALYLDQGAARLAQTEALTVLNSQPDQLQALKICAIALFSLGQTRQAELHLNQFIRLSDQDHEAFYQHGAVLEELGQWDQALAAHRKALTIKPDFGPALSDALFLSRRLCLWDHQAEREQKQFSKLLSSGGRGLKPFVYLAMESTPEEQLACARLWAEQRSEAVKPLPRISITDAAINRVAYVSNGFKQHPTACLTAEYFEQHEHTRLRTYAYALGPEDDSPLRQRLSRAFDQFLPVGDLSHHDLAQQIRHDQIDILVDLRGYGGGAVTEMFARKPAPIQVNWLAYPGTMGAEFMDYTVLDAFLADSPGLLNSLGEAPVILPDAYQPTDTTRDFSAHLCTRAACGLPEQAMVYCCFNNSYKFSAEVFVHWMQILKQVPGSVLWLLSGHAETEKQLSAFAQKHGISPDRLVWMKKQPHLDYLARYQLADLFLDTRPYNAHTTASDALWAGCPVLTCPGETFASRVGGSLVHNAKLQELVVDNLEQYQKTAVELGHDPEARVRLRKRLKEEKLPLFQTRDFAQNMSTAFDLMLTHYRAGKPPQAIDLRRPK